MRSDTLVTSAWYERLTHANGVVHLVLEVTVSAGCVFGEVASSGRRRRHRRRREIALKVTNNIPEFTGLMPGELELILPVVTRLLDGLSREAETRSTHEEAEANQED